MCDEVFGTFYIDEGICTVWQNDRVSDISYGCHSPSRWRSCRVPVTHTGIQGVFVCFTENTQPTNSRSSVCRQWSGTFARNKCFHLGVKTIITWYDLKWISPMPVFTNWWAHDSGASATQTWSWQPALVQAQMLEKGQRVCIPSPWELGDAAELCRAVIIALCDYRPWRSVLQGLCVHELDGRDVVNHIRLVDTSLLQCSVYQSGIIPQQCSVLKWVQKVHQLHLGYQNGHGQIQRTAPRISANGVYCCWTLGHLASAARLPCTQQVRRHHEIVVVIASLSPRSIQTSHSPQAKWTRDLPPGLGRECCVSHPWVRPWERISALYANKDSRHQLITRTWLVSIHSPETHSSASTAISWTSL